MRKVLHSILTRTVFTLAAIGLIVAAGALDGGGSQAPAPNAAYSTPTQPVASTGSYRLHAERGPHTVAIAKVVTGTLLLTGLIVTALGAVGTRAPRRPTPAAAPPAFHPYLPVPLPSPRPVHPGFGPTAG